MDWSALRTWIEQPAVAPALGLAALAAACWLAEVVTRRGLVRAIRRLVERTSTAWDDRLVAAEVFERIAHLAPALVAWYGVRAVPGLPEAVVVLVQRVAAALMVVFGATAISAFLNAVNGIWISDPKHWHRPIKGYLQVAKIVLAIVSGVLVLAILMDRSPALFLSGIGALTAVLLLIFRDTLLSLVASVQLTAHDMLRVGDWIEMPQFGADGDVIDVALHTVKVQNWDKTITTIPTHKLIENSFVNWRGMKQTGGRRIKRCFHVDMTTVRFLEPEEIERFAGFALLRDYVRAKQKELEAWNAAPGLDPAVNADVRRLTNVGTLRAYLFEYLRRHPRVHQGLTLMVRQLQPGPDGLPIEIYCFTTTTAWVEYEGIQADIFDHVLAVAPDFGLRVFQHPAGSDIARLAGARAGDAPAGAATQPDASAASSGSSATKFR